TIHGERRRPRNRYMSNGGNRAGEIRRNPRPEGRQFRDRRRVRGGISTPRRQIFLNEESPVQGGGSHCPRLSRRVESAALSISTPRFVRSRLTHARFRV